MGTRTKILAGGIAGMLGVFSVFAMGVGVAKANTQPSISGTVTVSGNTITVSGSYASGQTTVNTQCGAIIIPLPEGGSTTGFSYTTDTGKSGNVPYTVTKSATTQTCAGLSGYGNPELGTFSVSFTDNVTAVHTVTLNYYDDLGDNTSASFTYGSVPPPPTASITASPTTITLGQSTTISGTCTNSTSASGSGAWSGSVALNGSGNFSMSETPTSAGTATYTVTCTGPGGSANASVNVTVNIATGTITVSSYNENYPSVGVPARWLLADGATDVCLGSVPCQGTYETYPNEPVGTVDLPPSSISLVNSSGTYVLRSMFLAPIAQKRPVNANDIVALVRKFFSPQVAEAFSYGSYPEVQNLMTNQTVIYTIIWAPVANMGVTPATLSLTSAAGSSANGSVTVTNTGAPGSILTWTASSNVPWLTVSPPADATGLQNGQTGNASESVTINANSSGLSVGSHLGTITFSGTSAPGPSTAAIISTVTVTYTVTNAGGAGYSCASNACVAVPSGAQYATVGACDTACGFSGSVSGVSVSCSPSTVYTNGTSTCTATVNGTGGYSSGVFWSTNNGTVNASGRYTAPGTAGSATVNATSIQDPTQAGNAAISITNPPPPLCTSASCQATCNPTLTASPSSIVVPEASNLSYYCYNVTSCTLSDSGGSVIATTSATGGVVSSTAAVNPSVTTNYILSCTNNNYTSDTVTKTVQVTVGGSGQCEQNPNGVGCPHP